MGYLTCRYRKSENGEIESQMFDSDEVPEGWFDSPAELKNGSGPISEKPQEVEESEEMEEKPKLKFKRKSKKRGN